MKKIGLFLLAFAMIFYIVGCGERAKEQGETEMTVKIVFKIEETELSASLVENAATKALIERLETSPITVKMDDYGGWEKVGSLGFNLPTSNSQITALPCEFVLYQGNRLVIFYGSNSWSYTRLGRFDDLTAEQLKTILGSGSVTVAISLK